MVSELIVADEEVVVAGAVLSEQPTTVTRAQTASKARTRFFIVSIQLAESKPSGQWGKKRTIARQLHVPATTRHLVYPPKRIARKESARKMPEPAEAVSPPTKL